MKVGTACSSLGSLLSLRRSLTSLEGQGGSPEEDKTSSWHLSVPVQGRNGVSTLSDPGKVQVQNRNSHQSGGDKPEAGLCLLHLRGGGLALASQSRAVTEEMLITSALITVIVLVSLHSSL